MRQSLTKKQNMKLLKLFRSRMKDVTYEVLEVREFPGGCVDRHILRGTTISGEPIEAHVCLIVEVGGGLITRIYEYLDQASVAAVFEEKG